MAQKVTLTGTPINDKFREHGKGILSFEMKELGTNHPKGINELIEPVIFTVFCTEKQLKKIELTNEKLQEMKEKKLKLLIMASIVIKPIVKIDTNSAIYVVVNSIAHIEPKVEEPPSEDEPPKEKVYQILKMEKIKVPYSFQKRPPNPEKLALAKSKYLETGKLEKPVIIDRNNVLLDGYTRYLLFKELGIDKIPFDRIENVIEIKS